MNDIIVQFAVLWGQVIGSSIISSKEMEIAEEMKQYDSEELLKIFSGWADEYKALGKEDTVEFFESKLTDLMHEQQEEQLMKKDTRFEKLKRELFMEGDDALVDFLGFEFDQNWEKDTIENAIDEVYEQMPEEELEKFYKKFNIK